jgi:DNA-binding CsgD family transcriptional regulator
VYIPDHSLPFIREFIRIAQSRPINRECIHDLFRPLLATFSSEYAAVLLLPNRYVRDPVFISNNPPEFLHAYLPLLKKDFLMSNLVETTGITLLSSFSPDYLADNEEFCTAVQKIRPVSDICYVPLMINGYLAGYLAIGRAGIHSPGYKRDELEVFTWLTGFLIEGYCRTLGGEPISDERALLDAAARVVQQGSLIGDAFNELFGSAARENPACGTNMNSLSFTNWYNGNLFGTASPGDLMLRKGHRTYRFGFRLLNADPMRIYFPHEPQGEIILKRGTNSGGLLKIERYADLYGLTIREEEMIRSIYRGMTNKEIAAYHRISPETVKRHIYNIFAKCGVRSRTQLVMKLSALIP